MVKPIRRLSQNEYNRVLDEHPARVKGLSQTECEDILIRHGATYGQAKNGAYVYVYHDGNASGPRRGTQDEYAAMLDRFGASQRPPQECIRHLKSLGFSYGQSKTAVYNYRCNKGLIKKARPQL